MLPYQCLRALDCVLLTLLSPNFQASIEITFYQVEGHKHCLGMFRHAAVLFAHNDVPVLR